MAYLLSTDVLLHILKPESEKHPVIQWVRTVASDRLYISVISVGEIQNAIYQIPTTDMRHHQWDRQINQKLPVVFSGRIIDIDERIVRWWARIRNISEGHCAVTSEETLIIATCMCNNLSYVSEYKSYHSEIGLQVIDPFSASDPYMPPVFTFT